MTLFSVKGGQGWRLIDKARRGETRKVESCPWEVTGEQLEKRRGPDWQTVLMLVMKQKHLNKESAGALSIPEFQVQEIDILSLQQTILSRYPRFQSIGEQADDSKLLPSWFISRDQCPTGYTGHAQCGFRTQPYRNHLKTQTALPKQANVQDVGLTKIARRASDQNIERKSLSRHLLGLYDQSCPKAKAGDRKETRCLSALRGKPASRCTRLEVRGATASEQRDLE